MMEIRPFQSKEEYAGMVDYFLQSSSEFLMGMGIDPQRMTVKEVWLEAVWADHHRPNEQKDRIYVAWIYDGTLVGHSSINKMIWGKEASIHLHLWRAELRQKGIGTRFFGLSANYFLTNFGFEKLYCEPYAENPAPNRSLAK